MIEADPAELGVDSSDPLMESAQSESAAPKAGEPFALVPRGGSFEGQVAVVGPTWIEGHVRGSLRGPGKLHLGSQARVEGRVECEALDSEGEIVGPVVVRTRARFGAGARVDGDLQVPVMVFDDDAILNGRAQIGGENESEQKPSEVG